MLQRPQHEKAQDSFLRFARDLLREFLIHARSDVNFFGHFDFPDALARAAGVAAIGFKLHALNGQRAHS